MSKAVLISIQPKWCELIANGKKTIEVRKTRPRLETPFKVYIYCTKPNKAYQTICGCMALNSDELYRHPTDGIKHGDSIELMVRDDYTKDNFLNGKVIGEFICNKMSEYEAEFYKDNEYYQDIREIFRDDDNPDDEFGDFKILTSNDEDNPDNCELCKRSCLSFDDFKNYIGEGFCKPFYGWHISNLVIYDKPKELSEFRTVCKYRNDDGSCRYNKIKCQNAVFDYNQDGSINLAECSCCMKRPPQSWCYVEGGAEE